MSTSDKLRELISRFQKIWILLGVIIILTILQPRVFLTSSDVKSILLSISIYGVMACGTIFTILLGGIDLSVGAVAAASGALCVKIIVGNGYSTVSVLGGIICGVCIGMIVGAIHGYLISYFDVPAFLVTLASQNIVYGVAQLITKNKVITCLGSKVFNFLGGGRLFGVPFSVYILGIMIILGYVILEKSVFGRFIYAVGGNKEASALTGINNRRIIIGAYIFSGFTAALAGIILASMNRQAIAKAAQGYETDVLTAIVVGGTSLMGGEGSISGAIWGALLVGIISNALRLMGIPSSYHGLVKGAVIICTVAVDTYMRYRNSGLVRKKRIIQV